MSPPEKKERAYRALIPPDELRPELRRAMAQSRRLYFADPKAFLRYWLRCAVLSKANAVHLTMKARSLEFRAALELRFDGTPFSVEELRFPYGGLRRDVAEASERRRHLAVGILAALRTETRMITVSSGQPPDRVRLRVRALDKYSIDHGSDERGDTTVRFHWTTSLMGPPIADYVRAITRDSALLEIPLYLNGIRVRRLPDWPEGRLKDLMPIDDEELRGWIGYARKGRFPGVRLYRNGVFAGEAAWRSWRSPVQAYVNDDDFNLKASFSSVSRDKRFREAVGVLIVHAKRLPPYKAPPKTEAEERRTVLWGIFWVLFCLPILLLGLTILDWRLIAAGAVGVCVGILPIRRGGKRIKERRRKRARKD